MKKLLPLIAFLFFITTAFAQVKVAKAKITFQIKNLGINTNGFFGNMQANIQFDPAALATSTIEATADVNSINTDNDTRDEHLRSDEFFDVAKFPKITMKSVSFKHKSGNNYSGQFNLIMKNHTKSFEVPFTYVASGNNGSFKGSFKLNRLDFGVGEKSLVLSNDVTVNLEVETSK
ncbi:MAG: YceI family protein [Sphingobacteriaceae bacterium]|nr:MAG: YceI family protein [Sphingobacteriaceae bacterium]